MKYSYCFVGTIYGKELCRSFLKDLRQYVSGWQVNIQVKARKYPNSNLYSIYADSKEKIETRDVLVMQVYMDGWDRGYISCKVDCEDLG